MLVLIATTIFGTPRNLVSDSWLTRYRNPKFWDNYKGDLFSFGSTDQLRPGQGG